MRWVPLCLVPLGLGLAGPSLAASQGQPGLAVHRFALLVGSNDGGPERVTLRYAHTDAQAMGEVLTELGGVAPEDRMMLTDPDRAELERAFTVLGQRVRQAREPRTEVVFYYSGHSDEEGLLLGGQRFTYQELREEVGALPAQVRIGILDSCASGAMVRGKGGVRRAPFLVDASTEVKGYAYLTSSSADEAAQEADRIEGSFFTHALVSGLRGAADLTGDGRVTFNEAYQYAFHATLAGTERTSYGPQHPGYDIQMAGSGDLVLTDLRTTSAALRLDGAIFGRTSLRDADGRLVLELEKTAGNPVELGLSPGDYTLVVRQEDRFAQERVQLREGATTDMAAADLDWSRGELARARGDRALPRTDLADSWFRVGLVPTGGDAERRDHAVVGILAGSAAELQGVSAALGAYRVEGLAQGAMAAVGGNVVGGDLMGAQASVGVNRVEGDATALQATAGANLVGGHLHGLQAAGGFNYAGSVQGVQWSHGVNVTPALDGTQLGIVNVGLQTQGAQLGVINVAREVHGTQLGIINVAERSQAPIGLLSLVKEGRHSLAVSAASDIPYNAELKLGGERLYNVFGAGADGFCSDADRPDCATATRMYVAYGLGGELTSGKRAWFDLDLGAATYFPVRDPTGPAWSHPTLVPRARVAFNLLLFGHLAPYVGAGLNLQIPLSEGSVGAVPDDLDQCSGGTCSLAWPSGFAGVAVEF
ncbi:MAG: caspase family protein [Pseudomonadota bacterium]